jgi:iron-sulfur cluster insertion protein
MSDLNTLNAAFITLSDSAARRIRALREKQGDPNLMLRLSVHGGGCSGFQYQFEFGSQRHDDDIMFEHDGATLVTDPHSMQLLGGTVVDFVETLMAQSFEVKNPNAKSSCGCGASFSL